MHITIYLLCGTQMIELYAQNCLECACLSCFLDCFICEFIVVEGPWKVHFHVRVQIIKCSLDCLYIRMIYYILIQHVRLNYFTSFERINLNFKQVSQFQFCYSQVQRWLVGFHCEGLCLGYAICLRAYPKCFILYKIQCVNLVFRHFHIFGSYNLIVIDRWLNTGTLVSSYQHPNYYWILL